MNGVRRHGVAGTIAAIGLASVAISTREPRARWLRPFAWATGLSALVIQQWALTVTMHA